MKPSNQNPTETPAYDYLKSASAQDCTGLIPFAASSKAELEAYEELYPFLPPTPHAESDSDSEETDD